MRLIDAVELLKTLDSYELTKWYRGDLMTIILSEPTIDAEPVRHGKWINEPPYKAMDGTYRKGQECSVCHAYFVSDGNKPYSNHPYCCECGAKMDGE